MELTTHYLNKPSKPGADPYCFSSPTGEFGSVQEAADIAKTQSDAPKMKADSFYITDATGKELERWQRDGSGGWRKVNA